jgi:hypothetical protein
MKRTGLVLSIMGVVAPAHAVQEVTLKDLPPLQPVQNCRYADGHYAAQNGPCPPDTTEVGLVAVTKPDGTLTFPPVTKPQVSDASAAKAGAGEKSSLQDFWISMAKWLGFALVVGLVAKFLKRSFFLWFVVGFIVRFVLVALNVISM